MNTEERIILLEKQVLVIHEQINRLVSDAESEKATRSRVNKSIIEMIGDLDKRTRLVEKSIWIGFGVLAAIQFLLK